MEENENVVATALREARKPEQAVLDDGRPVIFVPDGWDVQDAEKYLHTPMRKQGQVTLEDTDSFVAYVVRHKNDAALIYCDARFDTGSVTLSALLNDHATNTPGWRDFRATYAVRGSEEWKRWASGNGKAMKQAAFAAFLEDNLKDIASVDGMPTGAQMLELALNFEASQDARFKQSLRLQSGGVDLSYVDKEDEETLKHMKLFERFTLGMAPFFNGAPYQVQARLRYRIEAGVLTLWYELIRTDLVVQAATKELLDDVRTRTGLPVLYGKPG